MTANILINSNDYAFPRKHGYFNVLPWFYNIIMIHSDKGGGVIIMDSTSYYNKIMELLKDQKTCEKISLLVINKI